MVMILLLLSVTRHELLVYASVGDVIVARQHHRQQSNGNRSQAAVSGKRWAPTEIRMNEFIHKIRSRFNSQPEGSFVRRAVLPPAIGQPEEAFADDRRTVKPNKKASSLKLYRLRSRFIRIPSAVNVGEKEPEK